MRLAQEGADVVVVDVCGPLPGVDYASAAPEDLEETVRLVEATGQRTVPGQVDVRDLDALRAVVDGAVVALGHLDVVVANAGICIPRSWHRVTPEISGTPSTSTSPASGTRSWSAPRTWWRRAVAR